MNQNFPRLEHGWGAMWDASGGSTPIDRYVSLTDRTQGTAGSGRGRQYETDQVQSGTLSLVVSNNDGVLDPSNASGPFYGHIMPYQPYRLRAQWPPTTNMFSQEIASASGLAWGTADQGLNGPGMFGSNLQVVNTGSAFAGATVWQADVASGTGANFFVLFTYTPTVRPGTKYTLSMYARVITDGVNPTVQAEMGWLGSVVNAGSVSQTFGTPTVLTGSSTATGWTRLTVTGTAPANSYGVIAGISMAVAAPAAFTIQGDGFQWEEGATATAYNLPGTWYPVFSGFVERWPQTWTDGATRSIVQPTAVDAFALLSQRELRDVLTEEIYSNSPRFLYTLGDPEGSSQATDATGNYRPASVNNSKAGAGSLTFGNAITATDPVDGVFIGGGSSTVCTISNGSPGTSLVDKATYIDLTSAGIVGPANSAGDWARMLAFRYTGPMPTDRAYIWTCIGPTHGGGSELSIRITNTGRLNVIYGSGPSAFVDVNPNPVSVVDGNWHLVIISYRGASRALTVNLDGVGAGTVLGATSVPTDLASDSLGNWIDPTVGRNSAWNFKGDIAYAAEFNSFLPDQVIFDLQAAWRNAFSGDSTDVRYQRILSFAGYKGATDIRAGVTRSMGPAQLEGQDALSALAEVVDTEGGAHFVSASGAVSFRPRSDRYNAFTPAVIFGENTAAGEIPYEDVQLDYDPTHLGNLAQVTQPGTGQVFTAQDATSQTHYFPRTITRTVNASNPLECQDAAAYLVSRYKNPAQRVTSLVINPSANPSLWSVCLGLELFTRARIMRRPLGRPPIVLDVWIENLSWTFDDSNSARLTVQCSPVDPTLYGSFAAWHTTIKNSVLAGSSNITVNAGVDNTNPLAAQIGHGQQLVLSPGTANEETLTVESVGPSSAGWTSAIISFSSPATKGHLISDVIREPLPAGITDPTTWDAVSAFDGHAFVY